MVPVKKPAAKSIKQMLEEVIYILQGQLKDLEEKIRGHEDEISELDDHIRALQVLMTRFEI